MNDSWRVSRGPSRERSLRAVIGRAWRIPSPAASHHAAVLRARIRALSPAIALVTLAWIPIDLLGLATEELLRILPLRLLLATGLLLLARNCERFRSRDAVGLFIAGQALCFAAMQWRLGPAGDSALRLGYGLFPFVLAAQLAVFPWPWGRTLLFGAAPLLLLVLVPRTSEAWGGAEVLNDLWLFGVILALAAWASHAQLVLLVDLLGARMDASHDGLTRIANRRFAEDRLRSEHARATRQGEPLSVLMVDIDHFKRVNDRYGHASGDEVLKAVAAEMCDVLRSGDIGARYGGEEFLGILPKTDADAALRVAERIRNGIGALRIPIEFDAVPVTVSIGVATLVPGESTTSLVARADAAMYRAKGNGRNRSEVAEPLLPDAGP